MTALPFPAPQLAGPIAPLHGLGGAKDLPIPAWLAITGGTAALVVSFAVLVAAWRTPRYAEGSRHLDGRELPAPLARVLDSAGFSWSVRILGLLFAAYATFALLAGPDLATNPVFGVFYVLLWVGLVPASLLFGRFFRAVSPVRTLHLLLAKATGASPDSGMTAYPAWLGSWPAAAALFAFVWQELVNPQSVYLGPLRLWIAVYVAVMLIGAAVFGEEWLSRADPFEAYSDLLAKLSPWGRNARGALVWRSPLANLATLRPRPGLTAMVGVLLGSTAFDSYKDTVPWVRFVDRIDLDPVAVNTAGLAAFCLVVTGAFALATMTTGLDPDSPYADRRRLLPGVFAPSVAPIIVGYMVAHYLSYFVEYGQTTILQLSDPLVRGANLLGTADWSVNYWLSFHPTALASIKVVAIVTGHVVGVIAAHDRALTLLPRRHQITGQLGLLAIMVGLTFGGLYLLFGAGG